MNNEDIGIEGVDYFKRSAAYYTEDFVKTLYNEIKDYKSRIEKAVEYIEYNRNKLLLSLPPREALDINELLDILNGRSDE